MKDTNKKLAILLRALEPSDLDLLYTWENDKSIWQVSHTLTPFSRYILQKYLENSQQDIYQSKQLRLMIDLKKDDGSKITVGSIDLFDFDPFHLRAGIGILVYGAENRNKGIATSALQELVDYAFSTLQLHQLYCNISADNMASIRLFKNAGFDIVGTKKEWLKTKNGFVDEVLLQLLQPNSIS